VVRYWPLADIKEVPTNVRFRGQSGHHTDLLLCPLMTQSGKHYVFTRIPRNDWETNGLGLQVGSVINGLFHMDLHLIVRLIIVVIALAMFWPQYWPVLAHRERVLTR
jgi:hypothetical protein